MKHVHPEHEKKALVLRLRKIKGQIAGIEKMISEDVDCSDVLMQVISARRALKSFGDEIIHEHMHDCIENAKSQAECRQNLRSLIEILERYVS